jgi:cytochrome c oxidase assembly factor CtaG
MTGQNNEALSFALLLAAILLIGLSFYLRRSAKQNRNTAQNGWSAAAFLAGLICLAWGAFTIIR